MRVLVLNSFFTGWTGSEIVAMEVAEHFDATTSSFVCLEPAASVLKDWRPLADINLSDFDLVWAQHHVILPLLHRHEGANRPFIVFASLSPYEEMETLPAGVIDNFIDVRVANSDETAKVQGADLVMGNAAPEPFHFARNGPVPGSPQKILFVSNNQPSEVMDAIPVLRQRGAEVRIVGKDYDYKRLEPADIMWADAVVTIGKTVRYALASGTPVFIYDRFGGDGYLSEDNYTENEAYNFSGRPSCRKLTADQLADGILRIPDWSPPAQPSLSAVLGSIVPVPQPHIRHPDLPGLADMAAVIGRFTADTFNTRNYLQAILNGDAGSWPWLGKAALKKIKRTILRVRK